MFCIVSLVSHPLNASAPINASGTFEVTSIILIPLAMSQILGSYLSITYLGFPAQFYCPPTTVGRVAETEWGPIRGSATQNWFEECSIKRENKNYFLFTPRNTMRIRNLTDTHIILALDTERLYLEPAQEPVIVRWTQKQIGMRHIEFGAPHQYLQVPIFEDIAHVEGIPEPDRSPSSS